MKKIYTDYMREKVEEFRHREILAYLTMIMGTIVLIGGLNVIFPYEPGSNVSNLLGLILTLFGFGLASLGFVLVFHYDREGSWFLTKLKESNVVIDEIVRRGKKKY